MTCASCGAPLRSDAMFCGECGRRVDLAATDPGMPTSTAQPTTRIPRVAAVPPVPAAAVAPVAAAVAPVAAPDVEETVLAPRRRGWRIVTPAGEALPIRTATVIGRTPQRVGDALPLPLVDPTRSLSKTHLRLEPTRDGIRIDDLGSTNGTIVVESDGVETELRGGQGLELSSAVRLELGEYVMRLEPN